MQVTIEVITPQIAEAYLCQNTENRNVKKFHVEGIARDMSNGSFTMNGDAIRFAKCGELLDGQHRLMACVKSGRKFETVVIRGLDKSTQKTMDSGSVRTAGDKLKLSGIENSNAIAASVKVIFGIHQGTYQGAKITHAEVLNFIDKNKDLQEWVTACKSAFPGLGSILPSTAFIISKKYGREKAREFITVFKKGVPSMNNCAAHAVRERFVKNSVANAKLSPTNKVKMIMHGAINFCEGKPLSVIRIPDKIHIPWIKDFF